MTQFSNQLNNLKTKQFLPFLLAFAPIQATFSQTTVVTIDPTKDVKTISPYIYGRNNSLPKESYAATLTPTEWTRLRESGVQMLREGGGNNATKYNWRRRLSSHPDWYNNVYVNDWDVSVKNLRDSLPLSIQGLWTFQLIGKAAKTNANNFNDWGYNRSQWWVGTAQNLAGGGQPNTAGGNRAATEGNPDLYLESWTADSTVGILDYWFNTLGISKQRVQYWNMDNEPEIWQGTHDDIMPTGIAAEDFMQRYFAVAKKARAKFPTIKLVGPVTANEWQWFNWANATIAADGRRYPWLEFFIKRCAEEQRASGTRLLDVLDIHFYPSEKTAEQVVQLHRVFFDRNYVYSGANGVRNVSGNWNGNENKEYIFGRINDWLTQYFGANHGIKLGLTEYDADNADPSVIANWYASTLGEFMKNEVEIFTPWSWKTGMWEVLHLFSRYNKTLAVQGLSSDETLVSAYPSVNAAKDSMTIVLINRSTTETKTTLVQCPLFLINSPTAEVRTLKSLPSAESFFSHNQNAIQNSVATVSNNKIMLTLSPLSVTSLTVKGNLNRVATANIADEERVKIYPNPFNSFFKIELQDAGLQLVRLIDESGKEVFVQKINATDKVVDIKKSLPSGVYQVELLGEDKRVVRKVVAF